MNEIEKLSRIHKKDEFDCGNNLLNNFLKQYALQNQERYHIGTTYVISDKNKNVIAYITLSPTSIKKEVVSKNKPYEELPVLLIARLAVDNKHQKRGFGKKLLKFAIKEALELSNRYGCIGIVVDSKPEAIKFYKKFGFEKINTLTKSFTTKMFLPIKTIKKAL